jgi:DNA-binding MarR family transcriptional regulator
MVQSISPVGIPAVEAASMPGTSAEPGADQLVDGILTELGGFMRDLRCGSTQRIVKGSLSLAQLHVLWQLEHHGALPMSRVAELLGVSLSNASGLIDRMAERGLIERVRPEDDRRVVLIRPGADGLKALEESELLKRERMRTVLRRLGPAQLRRLAQSVHDLRTATAAELGSGDHVHHFVDTAD